MSRLLCRFLGHRPWRVVTGLIHPITEEREWTARLCPRCGIVHPEDWAALDSWGRTP